MDSNEYEKNICRICLENNVLLDWNTSLYQFRDTTYKDCYYKYTQLECYATDSFPQKLCQNCCKALHSTHTLILTALGSHKVLQDKLSSNNQLLEKLNSPTSNNCRVGDSNYTPAEFETILMEEIEIEPISDNDFKYDECSDEDFSVSCKATAKAEKKNKSPIALLQNVKTKPKREQSVKTKKRFEKHLREPSNNSVERNASLTKSDTNSKSKVRKTKPISDNQTEMIIEQIIDDYIYYSEEEQTVEHNSIDYNLTESNTAEEDLLNGNKTEEEEETTNVESEAKNKYDHEARICSICSKILRNRRAVEKHEQTHLENRERKVTCNVCGLKFYTQSNLDGHMLTHKENREKRHKCEFCSKAFYDKGALNIHRRIHLGQMIPCSLCSKQYYRQIDLDRHMRSHSATTINSDIKKRTRYFVRCPHCDKSIRSISLKSHIAAHLNEPLMKCSICDKEFFSRKSCVLHVKKTHQKTNEEYNDFIVKYENSRISHLFLKQHRHNVQSNND